MAYVEVDEPIVLDSTGQDIKDELTAIKSAVQGLGTALGSDKANISGDNIASPATFRQNIGANGLSIIEVDVSGTTNNVGYIATAYDYNEYFIGGRFKVTGGGGCYAIFRPSAQNKVVILAIDDTLDRRINTAIEGKLYYLNIT